MDRQNILTGVKVLSNKPLTYNQNETGHEEDQFLSIKQNTVIVRSKQNFKVFKFDCCLSKHSTQQQVYDNFCLSMVQDFVQGYDCTVILCGQNKLKSGFNQIIIGKDSQETKGLIPRFIDHITNSIRYLSQRKCFFKVSFLEINEEQMIDLLGVKKCKLQIKQEKQNKNQFYVNNLEIKPLQKIDQIQSFYLLGSRKKQYAYSKSYRKRSNSTALFTIYLQSLEQNGTIYRRSKFTFCELSQNSFVEIQQISDSKNLQRTLSSNFIQSTERKQSSSQSTKSLNLSDYAFQNVVNTLVYGDQNVNVPFRDSKVTKLLRSSLGGNHKTSILGTVDGQSQLSLQKTFKILKILQIAAQIQNCPSNLKSIDSEQSLSGAYNIVSLLEQINQRSHEVQKIKMDLQLLLSNPQYVSEEVKKIKDQNGDSLTRYNQFCSEENLEDRVVEERTKKQLELRQRIKQLEKKLKENISYIHNLEEQETNHDSENDQYLQSQETIISKRKQILMRIRKIKEQRLNSMPNLQLEQIQRQKKREIFALQIQFQKQRNIYTSTIRNLEEKLSLYKKIAQNSLKSEEIQIIRANSKFDETKREFLIPMFMIKDKKMMPGNMISPQISQRKFLVSPRSSSFNSYHSNSVSKKIAKPSQMRKANINQIHRLQSRKSQRQENNKSQYQIEFGNEQKQQKIGTIYQQHQKSRQLTARISRNKSPSDSNKIKKNLTLMEKVRSSEHIKKVRSEYQIEEVDINRVIKYNEQRKILRSKQKEINFSRDKSTETRINLMRRQKLKTQIMSIDLQEGQHQVCQTEKQYFSKSPLKKLKRWM